MENGKPCGASRLPHASLTLDHHPVNKLRNIQGAPSPGAGAAGAGTDLSDEHDAAGLGDDGQPGLRARVVPGSARVLPADTALGPSLRPAGGERRPGAAHLGQSADAMEGEVVVEGGDGSAQALGPGLRPLPRPARHNPPPPLPPARPAPPPRPPACPRRAYPGSRARRAAMPPRPPPGGGTSRPGCLALGAAAPRARYVRRRSGALPAHGGRRPGAGRRGGARGGGRRRAEGAGGAGGGRPGIG